MKTSTISNLAGEITICIEAGARWLQFPVHGRYNDLNNKYNQFCFQKTYIFTEISSIIFEKSRFFTSFKTIGLINLTWFQIVLKLTGNYFLRNNIELRGHRCSKHCGLVPTFRDNCYFKINYMFLGKKQNSLFWWPGWLRSSCKSEKTKFSIHLPTN